MKEAANEWSEDAAGDDATGDTTTDPPLAGLPEAMAVGDELPASVSPFGEVPRQATYWGAQRVGLGGAWDVLSFGAPDDETEAREWPLADLSVATVRARWGAGTYRIQWLAPSARGGRKHLTYGRHVTVRALAAPPVPAAPPPAPASPFGPELDRVLQMQRMIGQEATEKMTSVLQFAAALANARAPSGLDAAQLELILTKQAAATAEANEKLIAAALAPVHAKLAALEGDDDDDDGGAVVETAARAAGGLVKGKGWLPTLLNWGANNPDVAKEVVKGGLPILASAATKVAEILSAPRLPLAQPVPVSPVVAPVGVAAEPDAPPSMHQPGSLSGWGTAAGGPKS